MITVHLILNAHIDPVWLWPWPSGLDTWLSTCRCACDLLDAQPDLHFSRGEAWGYDLIERVAPALFARIREHVRAGRWHIVGGWWIQPDCNAPSGFALRRQIELGKAYFLERFGYFPRTAYNVDSFGHGASLPALLRAAGQDRYVMMRPQEPELRLPARLFRWRGYEGGPEVVVFRIAGAYACRDVTVEHIRAALTDLPAGIEHTMCFVGLGDHGGGPTERQIGWCREHERAIDGCRLEFSQPERFFDAIWNQADVLPVVTGELQSHAIGCYSVHRPVKLAVRRAEHALEQAALVCARDPRPEPKTDALLDLAWRHVSFGHFHDILGGTCIPSAYEQIQARLGLSLAVADEIVQLGLRRRLEALPDDPLQRIVLFNGSEEAFDGYVAHEPWFEREPFQPDWRLIDEQGAVVPFQALPAEALVEYDRTYFLRLSFRVRVEPGELRVMRIDPRGSSDASDSAALPNRVHATTDGISNDSGVALHLAGAGELHFAEATRLPLPRLDLMEDTTDTWSHGIDRYTEEPATSAVWQSAEVIDAGPLMAALQRHGRIGSSDVLEEYRVYVDEPFVELLLHVHWTERHKLLKLVFALPAKLVRRYDGIPGDSLERSPDGRELPVRDRTLLELADGRHVGLVFPEAYALDATPERVRLTLLRSPFMAHHDPYVGPTPRGVFADQGVHEFRVRIFGGPALSGAQLDRQALMLHRPLVVADLTRGMRLRTVGP